MSGWPTYPIKAVASYNDEVLSDVTPADYEIQYLEIADVHYGEPVSWPQPIAFAASPSRARRRVRSGDVLVSTVRTYLRAVTHIEDAPQNAIASTGFAVLRARKVDSRFLGYAMLARPVIDSIVSRSVGISYPAINASDLVATRIPVPSSTVQKELVRYLDRETAAIDAFIADQEELIALLDERARSVKTRVLDVERLRPASMRAPAVRLGRIARCQSGEAHEGTELESSQIGPVPIWGGNGLIGYTEHANLATGNIVIGRVGALCGNVRLTTEPVWVTDNALRLRIHSAGVTPEFVALVLEAINLNALADRTAQPLITGSLVHAQMVPMLSIVDQDRVVRQMRFEVMASDATIADAREAIALSKERRAALISATVTGQIDVTAKKRVLL